MSFDTEVCRRLPLADATLHMLDFVADAVVPRRSV